MSDQPTSSSTPRPSRTWLSTVLAVVGMVLLALWTIRELGGFDLHSVVNVAGGTRSLVSTFATVDHPFHAARAYLLLESLRDGEILRWIPAHEGGYPVEFYPLGIPWLEVATWALLLGQVSIIAVHKILLLVIYVLPGVGFWILARGDRSSPYVALLALAIQLSVPGDWMHGGRMELVYWGLVANVGGATFTFIMFACINRWIREGLRGYGLLAVLCTTAALYINTRSAIAVVVATVAAVVAALVTAWIEADDRGLATRLVIGRTTIVALLSALLVAPLLLPAIQYANLYYFVNFESYDDLAEIIWASKTAITPVFAALAAVGAVVALLRYLTKPIAAVALALVLYLGVTICVGLVPFIADAIPQLEAPRLMPFQRFLMIYLAAWLIGKVVEVAFGWARSGALSLLPGALLLATTLVVILTFQGKFGDLPQVYQQPIPWTTGYPEFGEFEDAVTEIDTVAPDGTAVYIVGDQMGWWHEHLWAPTWSDREFFYDDWMWYWHPDHEGPYDPSVGHAYQVPSLAFTREWFDAHGVGAVLVTNMPVTGGPDPRDAARSNPLLQFQQTIGQWDLYLVTDPTTMVTNGDTNATAVVTDGGLIEATFEGGATGEIEIRRNWFPRWEAWADGQPVDIERTDNGYMQVIVPDGTTTIELRYGVTPVDWLGRVLCALGVIALFSLVINRPRGWWSVFSTPASAPFEPFATNESSPVAPTPLETARTGLLQALTNHVAVETDFVRRRTSARTAFRPGACVPVTRS